MVNDCQPGKQSKKPSQQQQIKMSRWNSMSMRQKEIRSPSLQQGALVCSVISRSRILDELLADESRYVIHVLTALLRRQSRRADREWLG